MMNVTELRKNSLATLVLAIMALSMAVLPACSSTEEAPPPEETGSSSGGGEDCSQYSNQVDIQECEIRNEMRQ